MVSATELVKKALEKNPNPTTEEIKKIAEKVKEKTGRGSPSLVYKWLKKMPAERRMAERPAEPVVRVDEEPEEIVEEPVEEPEFEVPEEFIEKEKAEEVPVEAEEEIVIEEEAEEEEEQRLLRAISKRAIKRLFGLAIEEGFGLGKEYGLTDQEAEDTEVLAMLLIAKYAMIEIKENLLEITSGLHFGSVGLKLLVAWIKKRREEGKRKKEEEERRKPAPEPEEPAPEPEEPAEEKPEETPQVEEPKEEPRGADGLTATEREFRKRHTH